jgi:hypothetical protein
MHSPELAIGWYQPLLHSVHNVIVSFLRFSSEKVPAGQIRQAALNSSGWYRPAGQLAQAWAASRVSLYLPSGQLLQLFVNVALRRPMPMPVKQLRQTAAPTSEYSPFMQGVQLAAPGWLKRAAAQAAHAIVPVRPMYRPAAQSVHACLPSKSWNFPGAQLAHSAVFTRSAWVPGGHRLQPVAPVASWYMPSVQ